jgi:tripartite-type tricarboxylate transporter receptor subunit TctC
MSAARRALLAIALCVASGLAAAAYPDHPIKWIVDGAGGSPSDVLARTVGAKLAESLGQPVVVENRPGASGTIAYTQAARSPGDGYTLVSLVSTLPLNLVTRKNLPYAAADFIPLALFFSTPNVVLANADSPLAAPKWLVEAGRARKDGLTFATAGINTSAHITGEILGKRTGVGMVHVPMTGSGPAINELLGKRVDLVIVNVFAAAPHLASGKVKALAVSSKARSGILPDVPTFEEAGWGPLDVLAWFGVGAPASMTQDIQRRLHAEILRILDLPETRAQIASLGGERHALDADALRAFYAREFGNWQAIVKESGIPVE